MSRFVAALRERHGEDLRAVWLYGSRARARPRREFSDVDLIVLVAGGRGHRLSISRALWDAAEAEGANPFGFSVLVERPEWPEERRAIEDFFIAGVDRDRVTLA